MLSLLTVSLTGGVSASSPSASSPSASTTTAAMAFGSRAAASSPVSRAIAFRQQFGLNSDPVYVANLEADPNASHQYGVAMNADEIHDMDQRVSEQSDLDQLTATLQAQSGFAGLYIDQQAHGALVIQTTGDPTAIEGSINGQIPNGAQVSVVKVAYTISELTSLQAQISSQIAQWRGNGVQIDSVGVDLPGNRVRVEVAELTPATSTAISTKYGPRVVVAQGESAQPASCISRTNCGSPLKGGLRISSSVACTSSFVGWIQGSSKHFVITAGHCIYDSGISATWYHNGVAIGTGYTYDYVNGGNADAGSINTSESGARNEVFASGTNDIRSMNGSLSNLGQPVGGVVCLSGSSSGYTCGTISSTNVDVYVGPNLIHHMWVTNYTSIGGDSGGTMMVNNAYEGIMSSITSTHTYYTTVAWVATATLINPCLTAGC